MSAGSKTRTIVRLISEVQSASGQLLDETLGQVICAILGVGFLDTYVSAGDDGSDQLTVYSNEIDADRRHYGWEGKNVWSDYRSRAPDVSLDGAIALLERAFPGWLWRMGTCYLSDDAMLVPDFNCPVHGPGFKKRFGEIQYNMPLDGGFDVDRLPPIGRPCLAMLEAMLMAKCHILSFPETPV